MHTYCASLLACSLYLFVHWQTELRTCTQQVTHVHRKSIKADNNNQGGGGTDGDTGTDADTDLHDARTVPSDFEAVGCCHLADSVVTSMASSPSSFYLGYRRGLRSDVSMPYRHTVHLCIRHQSYIDRSPVPSSSELCRPFT